MGCREKVTGIFFFFKRYLALSAFCFEYCFEYCGGGEETLTASGDVDRAYEGTSQGVTVLDF